MNKVVFPLSLKDVNLKYYKNTKIQRLLKNPYNVVKKYKTETYYAIIGFIVASIITLFLTINLPHNLAELILSLVFLIIGILCGYKLGDK